MHPLASHAHARGPFFANSSTDTDTSWFLTPPPFASAQLGSTVNITWHSDRDQVRLLLHKRGHAGVQYLDVIQDSRWYEWTVSSNFAWDVEQPFALQATTPVLQLHGQDDVEDWWSAMFYIAEADTTPAVPTVTEHPTSASAGLHTSRAMQYTMAPEDGAGSGFDDDEVSKTRRVAGVVSGAVLGAIAVMMGLGMCIWRIWRKQPGAARALTADEGIKTETCAELPAETSVLDVSNLDEFAARYS